MPLLVILPVLLIGLTFLYLPFAGPDRLFSMRVQPEWFAGTEARGIRRNYQFAVSVVTALSVLLALVLKMHPNLTFAAVAFEILGSSLGWSWGWKRTLCFAIRKDVTRTAVLRSSEATWLWCAAALLPIFSTAALLLTHHHTRQVLDTIRSHGAVNANALFQRSGFELFAPLILGGTVVIALAGLLRTVQRLGAGVADNGRYFKLTECFVLVVAWMVGLACASTGLLSLLPSANRYAPYSGFAVGAVDICFLLFTTMFLIVNRKILVSAQSATDVAHWRAGLMYFNREDGALFVPKRLGFGWTLNWAQPAAWIVMCAILVLGCLPFALKHL